MKPTPKKIMVVEDEHIVQLHLKKIVESTGHQLIGAVERTSAALELARQNKPDLVLMDIQLAEGDDGIECAQALVREFGAAILFITAHSSPEIVARALPVEAAGYLLKPFRVAEVTASISSALASRERERRASSRERALSSAVEALEEAIFVLDSEGSIGFANPRGKLLSDWSEIEPSKRSLIDCVVPEDREQLSAAIELAHDSRLPVNLDSLRLLQSSGTRSNARLEPISEADDDCLLVTIRSKSRGVEHRQAARDDSPGTRLLVYSHDTFGLGHIRRCLNLIRAMSERVEDLCTLLVTGSPMAHKFELPARTDYLKLPAVRKVAPDAYEPRSLAMSEDGILTLRRNLLLHTVRDYAPNFLLVDHSPTGMNGELQPALDSLAESANCTRILGLRDIIDSPARVAQLWGEQDMFDTLKKNYDHVVVYGSKTVYDTTREYGFPEDLRDRTLHMNYVTQRSQPQQKASASKIEPGLIVVTIGGGDGGGNTVVLPFLEMMREHGAGLGLHAEVLLGPFLNSDQRAQLKQLAEGCPIVMHDFVPDPTPLFARAELVISTAGYNICAELLAHAHRALLIPRVVHREEQLLRAQRLAELGLTSFLHPQQASSDAIAEHLRLALADERLPLDECRSAQRVPLDGAQRMASFIESLVSGQARVSAAP